MKIRANNYASIGAILASAMLISCAQDHVQADSATANNDITEASNDIVMKAIASDDRPEEDIADDESRRPFDVLTFAGVRPGMTVFEIEAGSGYYTELFSYIVGKDGKVFMQNPESFDSFLGDAVTNRLANNRLANVVSTKSNFDNLEAGDGSVDLVTWLLGPHDLFYIPSIGGTLGDVEKTYAEIFRILKPGGQFLVLDHVAAPGSPAESGHTVHRIDPDLVRALAEEAGLELIDESDALRRGDDDYSVHVFDESVRRKTDRFLMKFRKQP